MSPLSAGFLAATVIAWVITRLWGHRPQLWSWSLLTLSWAVWAAGDFRVAIFAIALTTWTWWTSQQITVKGRTRLRPVAIAVTLMGFAATRAGPQLVDIITGLWSGNAPNQWWFAVGASFATFQAIMFIADADRFDQAPSWKETALGIALLPKAAAGPLIRPEKIVEQLRSWPRPVLDLKPAFLLGAAATAKIYVAGDILHRYVYNDIGGTALISGWDSILQKLAGPVMFWANVSALADVAVAGGLVIGIHLPQNFDAPLGARNLADLWRRWHVTVSAFFRDYVLRPFTGANPPSSRLIVGLVGVMTLSGFWHGYTPYTALWGTVNGIVLAAVAVRQRRLAQRRIEDRRRGLVVTRPATPWWGTVVTLTFFSLISPLLSTPRWDQFHPTWTSMRHLDRIPTIDGVTLIVLAVTTIAGAGGFRPLQRRLHHHLHRIPASVVALYSAAVISFAFGFARGAQPAFLYVGIW